MVLQPLFDDGREAPSNNAYPPDSSDPLPNRGLLYSAKHHHHRCRRRGQVVLRDRVEYPLHVRVAEGQSWGAEIEDRAERGLGDQRAVVLGGMIVGK